jgi:hypothetical protein
MVVRAARSRMGARVDSRVEVARISTLGLRRAPCVAHCAGTGASRELWSCSRGLPIRLPSQNRTSSDAPARNAADPPRCPPEQPISAPREATAVGDPHEMRGSWAGRAPIRLRGSDGCRYAIVLLRWAHEAMRARAAPTAPRPRSIDVPTSVRSVHPRDARFDRAGRFPSGRCAALLWRAADFCSALRTRSQPPSAWRRDADGRIQMARQQSGETRRDRSSSSLAVAALRLQESGRPSRELALRGPPVRCRSASRMRTQAGTTWITGGNRPNQ